MAKCHALKIIAGVVQHLVGVPVVREDRIAAVYAQNGVVAVKRRFLPYVARGAAFFAFGDDIAFLRF